MDYKELIDKYGTPMKAAFALGFWRENSSYKTKRKACGRVCNWKRNGLPKKIQEKLAKMEQFSSALP